MLALLPTSRFRISSWDHCQLGLCFTFRGGGSTKGAKHIRPLRVCVLFAEWADTQSGFFTYSRLDEAICHCPMFGILFLFASRQLEIILSNREFFSINFCTCVRKWSRSTVNSNNSRTSLLRRPSLISFGFCSSLTFAVRKSSVPRSRLCSLAPLPRRRLPSPAQSADRPL